MVRSDTQRECVPSEYSKFTLFEDDDLKRRKKFAFHFTYLGCRTGILNILHGRLHFVCAECPAECELCVNSDTCTQCRQGLYQLSGRCHHVCPEDYEPNEKLMECTPQGQSSVSVDML